MTEPPPVTRSGDLPTVFFLSDYGFRDEFVGVVHAVIRRLAPNTAVIDLTHDIAPYDVRAGAATLARAAPHLGPGIMLGVVDPGVGGARRAIVIETPPGNGPAYLVGPDNGLLLPAADVLGGVSRAFACPAIPPSSDPKKGNTFDGRDVFAPVAAALSDGADPTVHGAVCDPATLQTLPDPVCEQGRLPDGRRVVRAEVTWVDRYGNVQLAADASHVPTEVEVVGVSAAAPGGAEMGIGPLPRVSTFSDLEPGAGGLILDASGRLALVLREASFADRFGCTPGDLVELVW